VFIESDRHPDQVIERLYFVGFLLGDRTRLFQNLLSIDGVFH
jgi:hypothetical protein